MLRLCGSRAHVLDIRVEEGQESAQLKREQVKLEGVHVDLDVAEYTRNCLPRRSARSTLPRCHSLVAACYLSVVISQGLGRRKYNCL